MVPTAPSRRPVPSTTAALARSRRPALLPLAVLLLVGTALTGAPGDRAETPPDGLGGFSPGFLITDTMMFDAETMTRAEVDAFLDD